LPLLDAVGSRSAKVRASTRGVNAASMCRIGGERCRRPNPRASYFRASRGRVSSYRNQENAMERVLVGVFDSKQEMEAACRELKDCAIPEERIHIRAIDESLRAGMMDNDGEDRGTGFFQRLFHGIEHRDEHAGQYAEAVRRGGCVVIVDRIDENRVDEAVKVMERHGAFDIDERAANWRERGWQGYDPTAPRLSPAEVEAERRYREPRRPTGAQQMAAQNVAGAAQQTSGRRAPPDTRVPVVDEELQVGERQAQRGGVRMYSRTSERP